MRIPSRILWGGALLLALSGSYFLWQRQVTSRHAASYRTERVQLGNIAQIVSANGSLTPIVVINVGAQITGKVQKIYADFTDHVKAGQVLVELDSALLNTELAQSLAALTKAQANLNLALANMKRGKALYQQHFISQQEWEQLLQLQEAARAELKLAEAQVNRDRTRLEYATIYSPIAGVVVDRQVNVGQTVTAGFQTPILFQIAQDLSKMQIDSSFAEADIGNIAPGQEATFTVDAFPHQSFYGKVKQIRLAPIVQQHVVTYNVVVTVDNKDKILLPGMTAYVNIKTAEHKNTLLVPNAALRFKPKVGAIKPSSKQASKTGTLYKLVANNLCPIECRLGISNNTQTEVFSPELKAGDVIVVGSLPTTKTTASFRFKVFK